MLTARGDDPRLSGLESASEDYLSKPFSPNELLARALALLRRTQRAAGGAPGGGRLRARLWWNPQTNVVSSDGSRRRLTAKSICWLPNTCSSTAAASSRDVLLNPTGGVPRHGRRGRSNVHVRLTARKKKTWPAACLSACSVVKLSAIALRPRPPSSRRDGLDIILHLPCHTDITHAAGSRGSMLSVSRPDGPAVIPQYPVRGRALRRLFALVVAGLLFAQSMRRRPTAANRADADC